MNRILSKLLAMLIASFALMPRDGEKGAGGAAPAAAATPDPAAAQVFGEAQLKQLLSGTVTDTVKAQFEDFKKELLKADRKSLFPGQDGDFGTGDAQVVDGSIVDTAAIIGRKSFNPMQAGSTMRSGSQVIMGSGAFKKLSPEMEQFAQLLRYKGNFNNAMAAGFKVQDYNAKIAAQMKALGMSEGVQADGGALVPVAFIATVVEAAMAMSNILNKVWRLPMNGTLLKIPKLAQAAGSYFGGMAMKWLNEAEEKGKTKPAFEQLSFTPHKLAGITYLTDELIADSAINLVNYVVTVAARAFQYELERVVLNGTGTAQPLGVTNDPLVNVVNRQTAGTITFDDIVNLDSRIDEAFQNLEWVSRKSTIGVLRKLKDNQARPIFNSDYATFMGQRLIPDSLLGYPINRTRNTPVLGDTGDIIVGDWGMYMLAVRQDMTFAQSTDVAFTTDETCLRFVGRYDGKPAVSWAFAMLGGKNS